MTSRFACLGLLGACVVGSIAALPSGARADLMICEIDHIDRSTDPPILEQTCHARTSCSDSDPGACRELYRTGVCDSVLRESFCRPSCGTVLRCDGDSDCPALVVTTARPRCLLGAFPEGSADTPPGVCVYPGLDGGARGTTYCSVTGVSLDGFLRCHTGPEGTTSNWFAGDCDGDGCVNGDDVDPCSPDITECLPGGPRGPMCMPVAPDGGVPDLDASTPDDDAGAGGMDAGASDAGAASDDSGSGFDGGNTSAPPGTSFGGGGGCRCGVIEGGASDMRALWSVLALALALALRRRR